MSVMAQVLNSDKVVTDDTVPLTRHKTLMTHPKLLLQIELVT